MTTKCKHCNKILMNKGRNIFCSKSCSASFNNSRRIVYNKQRDKVSKTLMNRYSKKYCIRCGTELFYNRQRKTCSKECLHSLRITFKPPTTPGGYRKGAGRGKHGWYDNVYFDSSWELAYYIYCKDHNIDIKRCNERFEYINVDGVTRMYHPDFRVNGTLTEIKGHHTKNVEQKLKGLTEPLNILYEKDLKSVFIYIENKTNLKIRELYKLYGDPMQN